MKKTVIITIIALTAVGIFYIAFRTALKISEQDSLIFKKSASTEVLGGGSIDGGKEAFDEYMRDIVMVENNLRKHSAILLDDGALASFIDGRLEKETPSGKGGATEKISIGITKVLSIQKLNDDYDIIAELWMDFGGSGTFNTIAIFSTSYETEKIGMAPTCFTHKIIGDRIIINSAAAEGIDYKLTVDYLDRKDGSPMAERPTEERTESFTISRSGDENEHTPIIEDYVYDAPLLW